MPKRKSTYSRSKAPVKKRRVTKKKVVRRKVSAPRKRVAKVLKRRPRSNAMEISGYGAYHASGLELALGTDPPSVRNTNSGFIISHREYICDVPASQTFTIGGFSINPGIGISFPWLFQLAQNFEEWVPRGMIFEFKSLSSDAVVATNANASLGSVIMATEYNPANPAFGSKQQMENYEWATSCKPSHNMLHTIETKKGQNPLGVYYTRNAPVPTGQDPRFFDLGTFYIATQGMQSSGNSIGELWCTYEIEFRKPKINSDLDVLYDHFSISTTLANVTPARPIGNTNPTTVNPTSNSTLKGVLTASGAANARYTFPVGQFISGKLAINIGDVFMIAWSQRFTNAATDGVTTFTGTGCNITSTTTFEGGTVGQIQPVDAVTATESTVMYMAMVTITAVDPSPGVQSPFFTWTSTGTQTTPAANGDFWVISMPNANI